jgi:hypothetical protein
LFRYLLQGGRVATTAAEPEVVPAAPLLMPELEEPLPVVLPDWLEVPFMSVELAVLSFTLPCASLQCVAAEMPALGEVVWAPAASMPPARIAEANSTVLSGFIVLLLGLIAPSDAQCAALAFVPRRPA